MGVRYEYLHKISPPPLRLLNQSIDSKVTCYEHYAIEGNPKTIRRIKNNMLNAQTFAVGTTLTALSLEP